MFSEDYHVSTAKLAGHNKLWLVMSCNLCWNQGSLIITAKGPEDQDANVNQDG